jgi:hypothetical protein
LRQRDQFVVDVYGLGDSERNFDRADRSHQQHAATQPVELRETQPTAIFVLLRAAHLEIWRTWRRRSRGEGKQ